MTEPHDTSATTRLQVGEQHDEPLAACSRAGEQHDEPLAACQQANGPQDKPRYTVKRIVRPLAQTSDGARGASNAPRALDPCIRPEKEDDDGYDPYADRTEHPALFERNPWD